MSLLSMLKSTCKVKRSTPSRSATAGGVSETFPVLASGVPIDLQADTSSAAVQFQKETGCTRFLAYVLPSQSVLFADRFLMTSGYYSGLTVEVDSIPFDMSGVADHSVIRVKQIITGGA